MRRSMIVLVGVALTSGLSASVALGATKDPAALRKQCAHLVKARLKIQDTGNVKDLAGVSGAIHMVDQCVANGGKVD